MRKYIRQSPDPTVGITIFGAGSQDFYVIRYADVLLMRAEAMVETGDVNGAIDLVNQVRARAYGDNSHDFDTSEGTLLEAIYTERRKELGGEGHGFFDLVRTGRAASMIEGFTPNKNEVFPIPLEEIQFSQGNWTQNTGY